MGGSVRGAVAITDILGDVRHFVANNPEKSRLDLIIERCESPILHLSSKSGETVETISCYNYLKENFNLSNRTVVTTSEGSELATYANKNDMVLFESTKQISGRFSAFSYYGIVPSYLFNVDVEELCDVARNQMSSESEAYNLGIQIADLVDSTDIIFVGSLNFGQRAWER